MAKHIAIVEDETAIRENYSAAFARQGYKVSGYADRRQSLDAFSIRLPDLVIIDVSLGDEAEGGFDLCRELRTRSPELPIIFLTAMDSELDVISGLRLGADDYLTKDISISQILARVSALFRRVEALSQPVSKEQKLVKGKLELDVDRLSAHWDSGKVPLSLTEFWLVHALALFPGHVKNRQQLMDAANTVLDDHTITTHIKRIRHKFCELDPEFDAIETVYGMGYRWVEG